MIISGSISLRYLQRNCKFKSVSNASDCLDEEKKDKRSNLERETEMKKNLNGWNCRI